MSKVKMSEVERNEVEANSTVGEGVSIAIPNWNHELSLPAAVSSALKAAEEIRNIGLECEVLVLDDFSRDGSLVLLRQLEGLYWDKGLRLISSEQRSGPEAARNRLMASSRFKYLVFVDADNQLIPENICVFIRSIQQTEAAVVYGNLLYCNPTDGLTGLISNEPVQHRLYKGNYIDVCAVYDKEQLEDVSGFCRHPEMIAHEDWDLHLHLISSGRKVVFVPLVFGQYNVLPYSHNASSADEEGDTEIDSYIARAYDQLNIREAQRVNSKHLRYHPDVGYI